MVLVRCVDGGRRERMLRFKYGVLGPSSPPERLLLSVLAWAALALRVLLGTKLTGRAVGSRGLEESEIPVRVSSHTALRG